MLSPGALGERFELLRRHFRQHFLVELRHEHSRPVRNLERALKSLLRATALECSRHSAEITQPKEHSEHVVQAGQYPRHRRRDCRRHTDTGGDEDVCGILCVVKRRSEPDGGNNSAERERERN